MFNTKHSFYMWKKEKQNKTKQKRTKQNNDELGNNIWQSDLYAEIRGVTIPCMVVFCFILYIPDEHILLN